MRVLFSIALAAVLLCAASASAQVSRKSAAAPAATQKEFDGFIAKFRAALKANDHAAVAAMSRLPFMKDNAIGNAAQFREKVYKPAFTAKTRGCLQRRKAVFDRDPQNNENFFIFCGEEIFVFTRTPEGFLFTEIGVND